MNRRQLQIAIGLLAVLALLLAFFAVRFHNEMPPGDRQAEELLRDMNRGVFRVADPEWSAKEEAVPVAALVRVMVRGDSPLTKIYRQVWDVLPSWLKRRFPRPLDGRARGLFVRMILLRRTNSAQALPVLAAVLTDPRSGNRQAALSLFQDAGAWVPDELVKRSLKGLQNPDPGVQLQVLESLSPIWPDQPDLQRRIGELRRELKP
ncbi:MAG TPA: hypothetical protein VMB21_19615 [Candidatus Limnocylindria bacterium]|jgi:hypothetical protein|nr:hypothetical protein [Candidatus Limnocylindria bacterium]